MSRKFRLCVGLCELATVLAGRRAKPNALDVTQAWCVAWWAGQCEARAAGVAPPVLGIGSDSNAPGKGVLYSASETSQERQRLEVVPRTNLGKSLRKFKHEKSRK